MVLDIGTSSIRAGYAGDDTPKAIIPTSYGYTNDVPEESAQDGADVAMADADAVNGTDGSSSSKRVKLHIGQHGPSMFRPNMEIGNPMKDGLSEILVAGSLKKLLTETQSMISRPYLP